MDKIARENIVKRRTGWEKLSTPDKITTGFDTAAAVPAGFAVGSMLKQIATEGFKNSPNVRARRALRIAIGLLLLGKGTSGAATLLAKKKK